METLLNVIDVIVNNVFEAFYIMCWILFVEYVLQTKLYEANVVPLKKEIEELNKKQVILFKAIKKLKVIIDYDHSFTKKQIKAIKEKLEEKQGKKQEEKQEEDVLIPSKNTYETKYNTHITFPHYRIYDKGVNVDDKNQLHSLKCLSHQLAEFMGCKEGHTFLYKEVESFMKNYFHFHSKNDIIILEPKLRKLLNICEDDNPEITWPIMLHLVEPHVK